MNASSTSDTDVLIIGAGPTGLVLALWLTRLGVRVRIVDKTAEPGTTSRALAVQGRTLELYRQVGLAEAVVESGRKMIAANLWVAGKKAARAVFGDMGAGLSPFPYALIFPQDEHERLLIDRLAEVGVEVERGTELLGFKDATTRVLARLESMDGASVPFMKSLPASIYLASLSPERSSFDRTLRNSHSFPCRRRPRVRYRLSQSCVFCRDNTYARDLRSPTEC
jgi:2-polyprenyl-6-methoxyphenol hydroxylase-like FAD-dependent oxidoreductase